MSWHLDNQSLSAYTEGRASETTAFSVEAHLPNCADCAERLAGMIGRNRLAQVWEGVAAEIISPPVPRLERALERLGVPEYLGRLLWATPGLRLAAALAVLCAASFSLLADRSTSSTGVMLVLAPLVPLVGVAVAFSAPRPAEEIDRAVPLSGMTLLLLRALPIVAVSVVFALAAQSLLPGVADPRWLLPALALSFSTLALARWVPVSIAGGGASIAWVAVSLLASTWRPGAAYGPLAQSAVFSLSGQAVALGLLLGALYVLTQTAASGRLEVLR
jgi:hypothetical protein